MDDLPRAGDPEELLTNTKSAPDEAVAFAESMPNDWYSILEVDPTASGNDIRTAYRKQALRSHPDRASTADKEEATARFKLVAEYVRMINLSNMAERMKCLAMKGDDGSMTDSNTHF